ncbi:MAG TPA: GNAT family N-acetyltransferase [Thermoanaerobaculia bacterium]|jgi:N-acetylglutamate synthase-like GNAT family acetyltransferase|nr:GNAT family N-acetyltransferase [Thermoanaerobaculia bacterium]
MLLRTAMSEDAGWIHDQYEKVHFIPSDLARDTIVVAEVDGERVGIGRLVPAGEGACELGGMFVADAYRGRGIAHAIVEELIRRAGGRDVYCIPFADLETLYEAAGFRRIEAVNVPEKIQEKLDWCAREIDRAVVLMKL